MNIEKLQGMVNTSPFAIFSGFEVVSMDLEGQQLEMRMPMKPEFERLANTGQMHGGPIAALIDTVGCYALVMGLDGNLPTIEFSTTYLRPVIDTDLRAIATVRKSGRSVALVDIDVTDKKDKLVAIGRGVYHTGSAVPNDTKN